MSRHSIEQYLAEPIIAGVGVLLAMAWYKVISRRGRPFEPTLWWLFRWAYVFLVASGYVFATLDALSRFFKVHSVLFALNAGVSLLLFVGLAAVDWKASRRRELSLGHRNSGRAGESEAR